jgi:subtilisin family serine protease
VPTPGFQTSQLNASGGDSAVAPADAVGLAGWGIHATRVSSSLFTGRGIKIALLDTGFQPPHPDFRNRRVFGESFVPGEDPFDGLGHGTHCGAVACGPVDPVQFPRYGVAGDADMFVFKVMSRSGRGAREWIEAGVDAAIRNGCEIICMPLAEEVPLGVPFDPDWEQLAQRALDAGSLLLAATGDESRRRNRLIVPTGSPANCPSIVAVGAVDESLGLADFSNVGYDDGSSSVDFVAPGVNIFSAFLPPSDYQLLSGTSQAVAFAAGVAALHAEASHLRGRDLRERLRASAQQLSLHPVLVGAGLIQAP